MRWERRWATQAFQHTRACAAIPCELLLLPAGWLRTIPLEVVFSSTTRINWRWTSQLHDEHLYRSYRSSQ